jgi:hypothetical protein
MTNLRQPLDRDEVLFAFHQACARPTAENIIEWTSKFPQFADDIRAHASVSRDWDARKDVHSEKPSETELARAFSHALNALYNAEVEAASTTAASTPRSFHQILSACGKDVPTLAREMSSHIGIARSVLADLVNGRIRPPVGNRFLNAVMGGLSITSDAFYGALEVALNAPRIGQAKATTTPTVIAQSYEEVIRSSAMTPEQIQYWLDED